MIKVSYVPAFDDNYIWLIHKENDPHIVIVDPGDAGPVLDAIAASSYVPVAILVTGQGVVVKDQVLKHTTLDGHHHRLVS